MKRLMILLLILSLLLSAVGCSLPSELQQSASNETPAETGVPETEEPSAPEGPEEPAMPEPEPPALAEEPAEAAEGPSEAEAPAEEPGEEEPGPGEAEEPEETEEPSETDQPEPPGDWQTAYTNFLSDNYENIYALCYGGISGLGFIDLDLDGIPELVLFDSGASASMGVEFFDIVDENGTVGCVSACIPGLLSAYPAPTATGAYVNANFFDDFRLLQHTSGMRAFWVTSMNGALDFMYEELMSFGSGGEVEGFGSLLTLSSVLYRYEETDMDSGEVLSERFERGGAEISREDYEALMAEHDANHQDTGYNASGIFSWSGSYEVSTREGFLSMVSAAIGAYVPVG